jgi:branched-chain amino acid transport system substrate-binding protein
MKRSWSSPRSCFSLLIMALLCFFGLLSSSSAAEIRIGAILAQTGPASFLGGPEAKSLHMLVDSINAQGGINGHTIKLIMKDSAADPAKAISFTRQLIEEEKVFAIIGPSTSGETLKIKSICEANKTILFSCASAELIVKPVFKYVFKTAPSDSFAARKIFTTMNAMNITKVAVVTGNTGFGKAGKGQLRKLAPEYGITIVEEETYDKKATDLTALITKIKSNPEIQAVINWSIVPAQAIIAKNMRQSGWDVPLFQSSGFANIKYVQAAGAAAEGIIFPASRVIGAEELNPGPVKDFLLSYKTAYESRYGEDISTFGGHSYDAMLLLAKAIEMAGPDSEKARDAVEEIKGFIGTAGEFNFSATDHGGLGIDAFVMFTVKDGRFSMMSN